MTHNQIKYALFQLLIKLVPPFLLSVMAKIASDYRKNKRPSFLSSAVIVCLSACGSILGYWLCRYLDWVEYKMTLTIFFFGLFSDKFFEFLFSKTFIDGMFNFLEDMIKENLKLMINSFTKNKK